jgi:hypothetical protein
MENWQSEFLQFTLIILATVWLVQRGSTESKQIEDAGPETDKDANVGRHAPEGAPRWAKARGLRLKLYENSLGIAMLFIFFGALFAQSLTNWPSEFLAVATMTAFSIYLRQRGSPESKPVGAPHEETGSSG